MLSAPDPYPLVSSHNPAPDDAEIQSRTPQICVDYLSHDWKDEDVWNSWKAMTKRKNEIANGVRLENASWRTWAKQRGNLKTVSPETLNWLKESDVTWLYGPLHGDTPAVPPPKVASTAERLGIDVLPGKKSILKHRTLSEILQTPMTVSPPNEESHTEAIVKPREVEEPSKAEPARERNTTLTLGVLKSNRKDPPKKNRHISFNTLVEQCIALEENPHSYFYGDYSDEEDKEEEEEEEYEEEDEDKDYSVRGSINSLLSPPKQTRSLEKVSDKPVTIAMMPPTQLKIGHDYLLPNYDDVLDGDGEEVSELNTRYSVADTVPETHDLPIDQDDGYDYYDSDEEFEAYEPPAYSCPTSCDARSEDLAMLNGSSNSESSVEGRGRPSNASILPSFDGNDSMIPKSGFEVAEEDNLMVHVHDLPNAVSPDQSLSEQDKRALYRGGPTPYNTPTGPYSARKDMDASIQSNSHASGALVAPPSHMPQVPLAEDYVEEDEGGLIASAVEILNTARDLFGAIIGSSRQTGRTWYD